MEPCHLASGDLHGAGNLEVGRRTAAITLRITLISDTTKFQPQGPDYTALHSRSDLWTGSGPMGPDELGTTALEGIQVGTIVNR